MWIIALHESNSQNTGYQEYTVSCQLGQASQLLPASCRNRLRKSVAYILNYALYMVNDIDNDDTSCLFYDDNRNY
jgi:hypothetical protein